MSMMCQRGRVWITCCCVANLFAELPLFASCDSVFLMLWFVKFFCVVWSPACEVRSFRNLLIELHLLADQKAEPSVRFGVLERLLVKRTSVTKSCRQF